MFFCVEIVSNPVLFSKDSNRVDLIKNKKNEVHMFTNITWTAYIIFISILLVAWYLVIVVRFYLGDLQILLSQKGISTRRITGNAFRSIQDEELSNEPEGSVISEKQQTEHLFEKVEILSEKIKGAVSEASEKKYNKEEFSFSLQIILKAYPELKGSPFQVPINNLVISECEKQGFIRLSAVELEMLWIEV
ncbi:MAG: hypothetical protein M3015_01235 [Bacteroidota bacterium]|nr:hypothetical protein [Bacteroidota bacterium]